MNPTNPNAIVLTLIFILMSSGCTYNGSDDVSTLAQVIGTCGDGRIYDKREQCDDGNTNDGDGCSAQCKIEDGYHCPTEGKPCLKYCGNGITEKEELCDDGNTVDGDGCSANCKVEPEYVCKLGEKAKASCQLAETSCGDGFIDQTEIRTEECDDGNTTDGDGCSSKCKIETTTYTCLQPNPDLNNPPDELALPITYRYIQKLHYMGGTGRFDGLKCPTTGSLHISRILQNGHPAVVGDCDKPTFNTIFTTESPVAKFTRYEIFTKVNQYVYQYRVENLNPFAQMKDSNGDDYTSNSHYSTFVMHLLIDKDKVNRNQEYTMEMTNDMFVYINGQAVIRSAHRTTNPTISYSFNQVPPPPANQKYYTLDIFLGLRYSHNTPMQIEVPTAIVGPSFCISHRNPQNNECGAITNDGHPAIAAPILKTNANGIKMIDPEKTRFACNDNNTNTDDGCNQCQLDAYHFSCNINRFGGIFSCKRLQ